MVPANLTPAYKSAEQAFKEAQTKEAKLAALEEMLAVIPKHKGTEKLQAELKKKLAKLRAVEDQRGGTGPQHNPFLVEPQGAGQIVVVGFPNTGKSALVSTLTNAKTTVADYPFATTVPQPGMMPYLDVLVQLVDTPPLTSEGIPGNLMPTFQSADAFLVLVDASCDESLEQVTMTMDLLRQRRLVRDSVPQGVRALTAERCLVVATKCDLPTASENLQIIEELWNQAPLFPVSVRSKLNLEELRRRLFAVLDVIRIYTKAPGRDPDLERPFVLPNGSTVIELAERIHKEVAANLKGARVWGSARFDGQNVAQEYVLADGDVVELKS